MNGDAFCWWSRASPSSGTLACWATGGCRGWWLRPTWGRNLSHSDLLEDETYQSLLAQLEAGLDAAFLGLSRHTVRWAEPATLETALEVAARLHSQDRFEESRHLEVWARAHQTALDPAGPQVWLERLKKAPEPLALLARYFDWLRLLDVEPEAVGPILLEALTLCGFERSPAEEGLTNAAAGLARYALLPKQEVAGLLEWLLLQVGQAGGWELRHAVLRVVEPKTAGPYLEKALEELPHPFAWESAFEAAVHLETCQPGWLCDWLAQRMARGATKFARWLRCRVTASVAWLGLPEKGALPSLKHFLDLPLFGCPSWMVELTATRPGVLRYLIHRVLAEHGPGRADPLLCRYRLLSQLRLGERNPLQWKPEFT